MAPDAHCFIEHLDRLHPTQAYYFIDSTGLFGRWDPESAEVRHVAQLPESTISICVLDNGTVYAASLKNGLAAYFMDPISLEFRTSSETVLDHAIVTQLEASRRKSGEEDCFVSFSVGDKSIFGKYLEDIPVVLECKSDQLFRGSTGLWALREYTSDTEPSFLLVSFVKSTLLFEVAESGCLEEISEFFGLEICQRTISIKNMEGSSCYIQVCPDKIRVMKSIKKSLTGDFMAEWTSPNSTCFSAAVIHDNYIFALESDQCSMSIFSSRATRETAAVLLESRFAIALSTAAFAVQPLELRSRQEGHDSFLVASVGLDTDCCEQQLSLYKIIRDDNSWSHVRWLSSPYHFASPINDMKFWRGPFGIRLLIGTRDGTLNIYHVEDCELGSDRLSLLKTLSIGQRPIQIRCEPSGLDHDSVFVLCGPSLLLREASTGEFLLQRILPRADQMVYWSQSSNANFQFFGIEHENLLFFSTPLVQIPRFEPWQADMSSSLQLLSIAGDSDLLLLVSSAFDSQDSPTNEFVEIQHRLTKEVLAREFFGSEEHVTCGTFIGESDAVVIGLRTVNSGQIRIFGLPSVRERPIPRRRGVSASHRAPAAPSLILEADAGFPHPVTNLRYMGKSCTNTFRFLATSDSDLHLLEFDAPKQLLTFRRTESWRQLFRNVVPIPRASVFAVTGTGGGVDIFSLDDKKSPGSVEFLRVGFCEGAYLIDKLVWCSEESLAITDRRGYVHVFSSNGTPEYNFSERRSVFLNGHIPCAMTFRHSTCSLLVSTIRGAILELSV